MFASIEEMETRIKLNANPKTLIAKRILSFNTDIFYNFLVSSGLKPKLVEMYKRLVLQTYGYKHLLTLQASLLIIHVIVPPPLRGTSLVLSLRPYLATSSLF